MISIEKLRQSKDQQEVSANLADLCLQLGSSGFGDSEKFQVSSILLNFTVPTFYVVRPEKGSDLETLNRRMEKLLKSVIGVNNVVAKLVEASDQDASSEKYAHILSDLMSDPKLVLKLLQESESSSKNPIQRKQLVRSIGILFCGSKIFSILHKLEADLNNTSKYSQWLLAQMVQVVRYYGNSKSAVDLSSLVIEYLRTFNGGYKLFAQFSDSDELAHVFACFTNAKKTEVLQKYLLPFLIKYIQSQSPLSSNVQLLILVAKSHWDRFLVKTQDYQVMGTEIIKNYAFQKPALVILLVALLQSCKAKPLGSDFMLESLLTSPWSNSYIIRNSPVKMQELATIYLLVALKYYSGASIMASSSFLSGVTLHLESTVEDVRLLGVIFAEACAKKFSEDLSFGVETLQYKAQLCTVADTDLDSLMEGRSSQIVHTTQEMLPQIAQLQILDDEHDSDDEDYDDPTIAAHNNTKPFTPVHLKDLHEYLVSSKDEKSLEKQRIALQSFSKVVRSRRGFGSELSYWSEKLASALLGLKIENVIIEGEQIKVQEATGEITRNGSVSTKSQMLFYTQLKLSSYITLLTVNPEKMPQFFVSKLLTGDFSLQERLEILNSFGLAARELKGYRDDINSWNLEVEQKISKLTQKQTLKFHNKFLQYQEPDSVPLEYHRMDKITQTLTQELQEKSKDSVVDTGGGTLVRISQRLLKNRDSMKQTNQINKNDLFSGVAYSKFISPFLAVWMNLHGEVNTLGNYTTLFLVTYLRNLTVLVHCSFPRSPDLLHIIAEVWLVLGSLRQMVSTMLQQSTHETHELLQCHLRLLLTILQNGNETVLVSSFGSQLNENFEWLNQVFENFDAIFGENDKTKQLVAMSLLRISEVLQNKI